MCSIGVNGKLLKKLSTVDKSLSFHLFTLQTHETWYRHGFIVDLSCDRSLNFMHKVFTHILYYIYLSLSHYQILNAKAWRRSHSCFSHVVLLSC